MGVYSHDSQARVNPGELIQEQIEEIQALRGQLTEDEVKKRFGIGSSRLYKIWCDAQKAHPDCVTADLPLPARRGDLPLGETPTVENFYKWLEGLETKMEQSTRLLMEVMAQLVRMEEERSELEEEREETWSSSCWLRQ